MNQILKHRFTQISRQNSYLFTIRQTPELRPAGVSPVNSPSRVVVLKESQTGHGPATYGRGSIKLRHSDV